MNVLKKKLQIKKIGVVFLFFIFASSSAQIKTIHLPENTFLYVEVNGRQFNNKMNWAKVNQLKWVQGLFKEKQNLKNWNDFSNSGIKYDATQYHYASKNDSVLSYVGLFPIENKQKFDAFIDAHKEEGMEEYKKNNYSYISLKNNVFIAWNNSYAVLHSCNYTPVYKEYDYEEMAIADSIQAYEDMTAADSLMAIPDLPYDSIEVEEPFDYKKEIEYLENEKSHYKEYIADLDKDIKYLSKHHKYPEEEPYEEEKTEEEAIPSIPSDPSIDQPYSLEEFGEEKTIIDSIDIENYKIVKKLSEHLFDSYFNAAPNFYIPPNITAEKKSNSDVYIWTNFGAFIGDVCSTNYRNGISRISYMSKIGDFYSEFYNSQTSYNLLFDKDEIHLTSNFKHNNPIIQTDIENLYNGKFDKKLTRYINDNPVGFYSVNIRSEKYFDLFYDFFTEAYASDQENKEEMSLFVETLKIALDEKAISEIATGNGIFVLNDIKTKTVSYIDYQYDDDYNEKEVSKTKEIASPDFTFAFTTKNEKYWNKLFEILTSSKKFKDKITSKEGIYTVVMDKEKDPFNELFFTVKEGIVLLTTSKKSLSGTHDALSKEDKKLISNYSIGGKVNMKRVIEGLEKEFTSEETPDAKKQKYYNLLKNKLGEITFYTENKNNTLQSTMDYSIKNNSEENMLMYLFNLVEDFYLLNKEDEVTPKIQ